MGGLFPRSTTTLAAVLLIFGASLAGCIGDESSDPVSEFPDSSPAEHPTEQPSLNIDLDHDFTGEEAAVSFEVEPNTTVSLQHVFFSSVSTQGAGTLPTDVCSSGTEDARIVLKDPAGNVVYDALLDAESMTIGIASSCGDSFHRDTSPGVPIAAGTWTVSFTGNALATGHVVLKG